VTQRAAASPLARARPCQPLSTSAFIVVAVFVVAAARCLLVVTLSLVQIARYRDRYVSALQAWLPARIGEELTSARGKLTDAEFRARLLDRLQAQRSALAQVISDIDRQVEAIVDSGRIHE
jgi:hypothetical protein